MVVTKITLLEIREKPFNKNLPFKRVDIFAVKFSSATIPGNSIHPKQKPVLFESGFCLGQ